MSVSKHTPGPWVSHDADVYDGAGCQATHVANCNPDGDMFQSTADANARLIAAAPDLLEALTEAVELILRLTSARWSEWEGSEEETVGDFRRTIAQATGSSDFHITERRA